MSQFRQYDPYIRLVGKAVEIRFTNGEEMHGRLLQVSEEAISFKHKTGRMVAQKNNILYVREVLKEEKKNDSLNHLRRSK